MLKVHYCDSIYNKPIQDLNPLILLAYPDKDILVICAREGQQIRLSRLAKITVASWWDHDQFNDEDKLLSFDVVVILDRDRIDPLFSDMLSWVERTLHAGC
jgi:hypothetical protein